MKDCDKRNSQISSKLHMIYIYIYIYIYSNNVRHPVTKTSVFTLFSEKLLFGKYLR